VVDFTLEEYQRNQSIRISRDIIGQSEEHEQKMQTNAQKLWENAHKQLVALLRFLDQDYDESCEKATRPLEFLECPVCHKYMLSIRIDRYSIWWR
jgi:hypothetical protein